MKIKAWTLGLHKGVKQVQSQQKRELAKLKIVPRKSQRMQPRVTKDEKYKRTD